ncbi:alpha/beta hydrolase [Tropicimonas sp. TH_r6]|uniref:alpha/beta fold hydrolase n=1 Tax=Tropicimonas sp. TH_r6 TaxID=3082085 RepID=UPI0029531A4C|nr:alpha/beta hydrolase [Tropicimonas sp. TH_r6]MDV7145027.1 alpha/beta hydrolase [Tropicimonas sp. TH_r6]
MESLYYEDHDAFLRWHRVGRGNEVLLCLPGLSIPASWTFLGLAQQSELAGRSLVMVDYFGSGDSDPAPWFSGTLDAQAEVLGRLMDYLCCETVSVVGHSMGGTVGIALALARPDAVRHLVVAEGNLKPGGGAASRKIALMDKEAFEAGGLASITDKLRKRAMAGDGDAAEFYGAWRLADPKALHRSARALVDLPLGFAHRFFDLPMPKSFVYGAETFPASPEEATPDAPDPNWLRANGVGVHVVPESGHMMVRQNPAGFAAALVEAGVLSG